VTHAARFYSRPNLQFARGDTRRIPLADAAVDVVTSFETIEHFLEQEEFLRDVCRVLKPDGFLLISTPDRDVYSPSGCTANPFHVRELSRKEFTSQLAAHFPTVSIFLQRPLVGSLIAKANGEPGSGDLVTYDKRDDSHFEENRGLTRAIYLIAIASKASRINVDLFSSVFIDTDRVDLRANAVATARQEISRLQDRDATAQHEISRLETLRNRLTEELNAIRRSSCWRLTKPIREVFGRFPTFTHPIKFFLGAIISLLGKIRIMSAKKQPHLVPNQSNWTYK
jgi:SAM-dependent methyltransferase